jgi:hypothetical protein
MFNNILTAVLLKRVFLRQYFSMKSSVLYGRGYVYIYAVALQPNMSHGLFTTTHRSWKDSSGGVIRSSSRLLPDNTQNSQDTNIHASDGIRIHNLSRRTAADLHLDRAATRPARNYTQHLFFLSYFM